jgi:predicted Zn-dependent protease
MGAKTDRWGGWVLVVALAGCATAPAPPQPVPIPARDWVADIRAAAEDDPSAIDVIPLAEPGLADLRARADEARRAGRHADAESLQAQALALSPDDPVLWQEQAEIALSAGNWPVAEQRARESHRRGPGVGSLCARNWLTVRAARLESDDPAGAAAAQLEVDRCKAAAPVRM